MLSPGPNKLMDSTQTYSKIETIKTQNNGDFITL